jgi:glycosyltransferase involved in cell wall biosynthesis
VSGDALDIVVVSQFFTPEMGAPAARFHDFGRILVQRGHRVRVVTGFPNSPSGVVPEAYRGRSSQREWIDGIEVLRGWLYTSPRLSKLTKTLGFGSFAASASLRGLFGDLSADVVIATSPPPTVGIPGMLTARRLRAPLVFDVRDIWPEAIALSGRLQSPSLIRLLEAVERSVYSASAAVSVVTDGKRERLIEKGVPPEKVHVLPNGVDLSRFDAEDAASTLAFEGGELLRSHGVDTDRFTVLYAGIFNPPQGLDILIDVGARLRDLSDGGTPKVQVVLVGAGSQRERLAARVRDEGLAEFVKMLPEQPRENIPPLLCASGCVAVTLRKRKDTHTVPSKIYEAMASGRPVLVSADGAPREILDESGAGFGSAAEDVEGLLASIQKLAVDPQLASQMGERGREHARRFDRRQLAVELEALLQQVAQRARAR